MVQTFHILIEHGVFKPMLSFYEKNHILEKEKENYSYARLVRKEDYPMEGILSKIGLALMSSLDSNGKAYSVFFVKDEDVLDFLFFENIIILKTVSHVYGYDWKNEKLLFKRHIQVGLSIDLVEPAMIIQTSRLNSLMIDPYTGKVLSKINGNGRFIDAIYDNGKTVTLSIVEDKTDNLNPKNALHFSVQKHERNKAYVKPIECQISFPYGELEYHQTNQENAYESYYEVIDNHRNTDEKLRAIYAEKEQKEIDRNLSRLQNKENILRTSGKIKEAEDAKQKRIHLSNEKSLIEDRYKENWFYNDGIKNIIRILGVSSKENVFYFSFSNIFFSFDLDKKEWRNMGYLDSDIEVVKVIPYLIGKTGEAMEDVLLFRRTLHSQKQYQFETIELSRIHDTGMESNICSKINDSSFIAQLNMKDVKDCYFIYNQHLVQPKEITNHFSLSGVNSNWGQNRYLFVNKEYLQNAMPQEKELFSFLRNDFSILWIKNNRLIYAHTNLSLKNNENNGIQNKITPKEFARNEEINSSLSIFNVPFIHNEDKEMIRKLREQPDWIWQTFKPEREMISVILPDMIRKYQETNESVYLDAINKILNLLKEIAKKKDLEQAEKDYLDANFAVEYAQSLMNTE